MKERERDGLGNKQLSQTKLTILSLPHPAPQSSPFLPCLLFCWMHLTAQSWRCPPAPPSSSTTAPSIPSSCQAYLLSSLRTSVHFYPYCQSLAWHRSYFSQCPLCLFQPLLYPCCRKASVYLALQQLTVSSEVSEWMNTSCLALGQQWLSAGFHIA